MSGMPNRSLSQRGLAAGSLLLMLWLYASTVDAAPPAVTLLPHETAVLISVSDVPEVKQRFMNTAWGRMSRDPAVRPLIDQFRTTAAEAIDKAQARIGLSLSELTAIPQGEITMAVIAPDEGRLAVVFLLDPGDHLADARRLRDKAGEALERSGSGRTEETVLDTKLTIYDRVGRDKQNMIFFEKDGVVVVGSRLDVLQKILAAWNDQDTPTLADNPTFNAVMSRCQGAEGEAPQVVAYFNPILLLECTARTEPQARVATAMLPTLGLDDVAGLGASLALDVGEFDWVLHGHALLDNPRSGVLEVIALGSGDTRPEPWVPTNTATYTTVHLEPEKIFRAVESVFDGFRGEGAFTSMLGKGLKRIAEIDFEKEVLPALDGRVTHVTWMERPVTSTSRTSLVGIKLKDVKQMAQVLDKAVAENEPFLTRHTSARKNYFQVTRPRLNEKPADQPADRPANRSQSQPCFGLLDDYLIIADRSSYEEAIRMATNSSKSLAESPDFKVVSDEILRRSASGKPALFRFERPQESMRLIYEKVIAQNLGDPARNQNRRNPFLRTLGTALQTHPLPPFAVLERYLAPQGASLTDTANGLHYMGFSLRPKLKE